MKILKHFFKKLHQRFWSVLGKKAALTFFILLSSFILWILVYSLKVINNEQVYNIYIYITEHLFFFLFLALCICYGVLTVMKGFKPRGKIGFIGFTLHGLFAETNKLASAGKLFNVPYPIKLPFISLGMVAVITVLAYFFNLNHYIHPTYFKLTIADLILLFTIIYAFIIPSTNGMKAYLYLYIIIGNLPGVRYIISESNRNYFFGDVNYFKSMTSRLHSNFTQQYSKKSTKDIFRTIAAGYPIGLFTQVIFRFVFNFAILCITLLLGAFFLYLLILYVSNANHGVSNVTFLSILLEQYNTYKINISEINDFKEAYQVVASSYKHYMATLIGVDNTNMQAELLKPYNTSNIDYYIGLKASVSNSIPEILTVISIPVQISVNLGFGLLSPLSPIFPCLSETTMAGILEWIGNVSHSLTNSLNSSANYSNIIDFFYKYHVNKSKLNIMFTLPSDLFNLLGNDKSNPYVLGGIAAYKLLCVIVNLINTNLD